MGWFTTFIYQPFFNLLVGIYWALGRVAPQYLDMGNAVIIFTIIFRIIWIPISLSSSRSAKERHEISEKFSEIQALHAKDPIREREETKKLMRRNRRIIFMSSFDIFFQIMVMLMLYRIFTTGLEGADFHLIYKWMPAHPEHFNLTWLNGRFDLTHPNVTLNLINSLVIFVAEGLSGLLSPFPTGRSELLTLFILPIGAFSFFAFMPAGKKLFVITTLLFSIVIMLAKAVKIIYYESRGRLKKLAYGLIIDKPKEGVK
ncbi:MAG: YidC/Oxa1 family membrane protein insertase [Candidatus Beckwithbacteria bacterium]|nr:YidC/Oxa1 family membrane protein insertase [Candidatus Beckwithbacteria bacterium]